MFIELRLTQIIKSGKTYQTQQLSNFINTAPLSKAQPLFNLTFYIQLFRLEKNSSLQNLWNYRSIISCLNEGSFQCFCGWSTPMTWLFHSAYCLYLQNSWANSPSRPFYLFTWKEVLFFLIDQHSCQLFCYQISSSVSCGTNHCLRFLTSKSYQRLFLLILELHDVHCFSSGD